MSSNSRPHTRLARLHQFRCKTKEAPDLLAPTYGWFTEVFDIADLKEAKALFDELSRTSFLSWLYRRMTAFGY